MDTQQLLDVLPHYLAMLILVFGTIFLIEQFVGQLNFWIELIIIVVVVFLYRPVVIRLGYAPASWERQSQ